MTYRIARMGWLPDPLDYRDQRVTDASVQGRLAAVLPITSAGVTPNDLNETDAGALRVDLRPWCSPIEDQGNVGSCTAQSVVGALEYFERKTRGVHVDASRLFLYRVTRRFLGWEGKGDTGAFVRAAIKSLRLFGVPPERYWPYVEGKFDEEPDGFLYALGQNFKAVEYFRVEQTIDHLKSVLDAGLPFAFGFTCFSSLFEPSVSQTGVIPYPSPKDSVEGGHAVLAVGYTDSCVMIRNSWGRGWGKDGYGFLPWRYFDERQPLADDCWVLLNAEWLPDDDADTDFAQFMPGPKAHRFSPLLVARQAHTPRPRKAEPVPPLVRVSQGRDPVQEVPMRLSALGVVPAAPKAATPLEVTDKAISLYLKTLTLNESFDFALFGKAVNELYVTAVIWDLSGAAPIVFPPANLNPQKGAYRVAEGRSIDFVGDGIQLWPAKTVVGGLYVRLIVMENDDDVRAVGKRISAVRDVIEKSALTGALAALTAAPTAAVITAIGVAALKLTGVIGDILAADDDDFVAMFDGTYGAESTLTSRTESYHQQGASIQLEFRVT